MIPMTCGSNTCPVPLMVTYCSRGSWSSLHRHWLHPYGVNRGKPPENRITNCPEVDSLIRKSCRTHTRLIAGIFQGWFRAICLRITPLDYRPKTVQKNELVFDPLVQSGLVSGVISSVADLARWASLLVGRGNGPPLPGSDGEFAFGREFKIYGLQGLGSEQTRMGVSYGHTGQFPDNRTKRAYFPEQNHPYCCPGNAIVADTGRYI